MRDKTITAAVILGVAIVLAACIVYTGLSNVSTSILRAGQDIGLKISNKNHIRVDVSPVEIVNPKTD
jgi:archaellum component FlaF (FlaF/FlaG flagellin family)